MKNILTRGGIEFLAVFLGIALSLYVEEMQTEKENERKKDQYLSDLTNTLEMDIQQINKLLETLINSEKLITEIQSDIDENHKALSDIEILNKLLDVEVGFSFFPQDGIFNQLISTGSFELIKDVELKNILLEMYNHQKQRNYATSTEIDHFNIRFRNEILDEFRVSFNYNSYDGAFYGSRTVNQYKFNQPYYMSNAFYGLLSQANLYGNMYTRQLKDIEQSYLTALSLSKNEVE
ncbi:MAG: hypothetical protein HOI72_03365 [Candidatus Marinimicrobia bacterium]|jgi:hypothetical protein|nr:hypothetical protein [Candidatus Neomarinimicrobiota bacterium]MBT5721214.1 hypothetical protein [Candidatus Neomarinimicrobiota bacterium]MBT7118674.1 hypothetical protein [Candidatus Neomarinimicrobiota bacterium]